MGYTTEFNGSFNVSPPLTPEQVAYLIEFAETRRMGRHEGSVSALPDPLREEVGLPIGPEGAYFVVDTGNEFGVINVNTPPKGQPGLWCQWVPSKDGTVIEWDGGEEFYDYTEWLQYLVTHFLTPWGRTIKGAVTWAGDEREDVGVIYAHGDKVEAVQADIVAPTPSWWTLEEGM